MPMLGAAPLAAAPANDDFAAAQEIVVDQSLPVSVTGTTAGATVESAETALDPTLEATVWFRVVSPADGVVRIDTDGSDFQTRLAVAVGSGYGDLAFITADDDPSNGTRVIFEVANGVEYWIQVSGWNGEAGNLTLNLRETEGGSISGTVSAADDGAPLAGIAVRALAYRVTFDRWWPTPFSPPSGLATGSLNGLNPKSKFLAFIHLVRFNSAHAQSPPQNRPRRADRVAPDPRCRDVVPLPFATRFRRR